LTPSNIHYNTKESNTAPAETKPSSLNSSTSYDTYNTTREENYPKTPPKD